jgi:acetolactate synthase-1/3 small subunit
VTSGSDEIVEQITKQLNKLVDVIKVVDLSESRHIERELLLIKLTAKNDHREEIKRLVDIFRGHIIDVTDSSYTIEMTGSGDKLDAFIDALDKKLILEVVRSGVSGIARGDKAI